MNIFVVGLGLSRTEDRNIYVTYIYVYITDVNCTFFLFQHIFRPDPDKRCLETLPLWQYSIVCVFSKLYRHETLPVHLRICILSFDRRLLSKNAVSLVRPKEERKRKRRNNGNYWIFCHN
jgi:hypothetical protein